MDNHIPDRRAVGVGHFSRLDECRPITDRQALERFPFGTVGATDGSGEVSANLADDRRQIPLGDIFQVSGWAAAARSLLKPPAVLQKEAPCPVGPDRLQHTAGFGRGFFESASEQNKTFGIVRGPVARLGEDPRGDGAGGFGPCPLGDRRLLDTPEAFDRRLRLPLLERLFDVLPSGSPRARRSIVAVCVRCRHTEASKKKSSEGEKHLGGPEHVSEHPNEAEVCGAHGTALQNGTVL